VLHDPPIYLFAAADINAEAVAGEREQTVVRLRTLKPYRPESYRDDENLTVTIFHVGRVERRGGTDERHCIPCGRPLVCAYPLRRVLGYSNL
jgi:hypothetical protein